VDRGRTTAPRSAYSTPQVLPDSTAVHRAPHQAQRNQSDAMLDVHDVVIDLQVASALLHPASATGRARRRGSGRRQPNSSPSVKQVNCWTCCGRKNPSFSQAAFDEGWQDFCGGFWAGFVWRWSSLALPTALSNGRSGARRSRRDAPAWHCSACIPYMLLTRPPKRGPGSKRFVRLDASL